MLQILSSNLSFVFWPCLNKVLKNFLYCQFISLFIILFFLLFFLAWNSCQSEAPVLSGHRGCSGLSPGARAGARTAFRLGHWGLEVRFLFSLSHFICLVVVFSPVASWHLAFVVTLFICFTLASLQLPLCAEDGPGSQKELRGSPQRPMPPRLLLRVQSDVAGAMSGESRGHLTMVYEPHEKGQKKQVKLILIRYLI